MFVFKFNPKLTSQSNSQKLREARARISRGSYSQAAGAAENLVFVLTLP